MAPPHSTEISSTEGAQESSSNPKFPFLSLIPKIPLGFLKFGGGGGGGGGRVAVKEERKPGEVEDSGSPVKPEAVRFPLRPAEVEPLRLHSEDAEQNSNPLVVWQIYALGGFILGRWAWAKWQERQANAKKDDSAEDQSPDDAS